MSFVSVVKGWFDMLFLSQAKEEFDIRPITSPGMDSMIRKCANIYAGTPYWFDGEDGIKTIGFAKSLCSEVARLATLGVKVTIDGSARATWLQEQIDGVYYSLRHWVEYGAAFGTVILKPNGESIDLYTPDDFTVTRAKNNEITGVVFQQRMRAADGKHWYTRLEYHRDVEVGGIVRYMISNKTYYSDTEGALGDPIDMKKTPWANLDEEAVIDNAEGRLYAVLRMPHANNIDLDSPMGLPIFSDAIEELKDLDVAYSRNAKEIEQSKRTILVDSDRFMMGKSKNTDLVRKQMGLPDMVKAVEGTGTGDFYQEINPLIQTSARMEGINALLSQIGYKVGFSNGYFVFNQSSGIQTATGVEAEQQRTIQFIKDVRDKVESALDQLIYALNAFADMYGFAPLGKYEVSYSFGDITYNYDEDRARWWSYVTQGKIPAWKYFEKFEGMTEEEARAMVDEAQRPQGLETLFEGA